MNVNHVMDWRPVFPIPEDENSCDIIKAQCKYGNIMNGWTQLLNITGTTGFLSASQWRCASGHLTMSNANIKRRHIRHLIFIQLPEYLII